jgi:hypothetical protein
MKRKYNKRKYKRTYKKQSNPGELLWEELDMQLNEAAGYVSYKNLYNQLGSDEREVHATAGEARKLKEILSWKKTYGGYSSVQDKGFCIAKVTDSTVMQKIDELHDIMSSKPFEKYADANPVFNSMRYEHAEKLREYNKPPYDTEELKIDGGRNMLLVSNLQDSDPMERRGKLLSKEIGEHLRVKILKGLQASTTVKRKDGMVLTWLETQAPVDGHKVVYKVVKLLIVESSPNKYSYLFLCRYLISSCTVTSHLTIKAWKSHTCL